ncbi:hypothetical protein COSO111634_37195 [Corallococcus soli]
MTPLRASASSTHAAKSSCGASTDSLTPADWGQGPPRGERQVQRTSPPPRMQERFVRSALASTRTTAASVAKVGVSCTVGASAQAAPGARVRARSTTFSRKTKGVGAAL